MTVTAAALFEAAMALPPSARTDIARRLLASVGSDEAFETASEQWLHTDAAAAQDALQADPSRAVPAAAVRAHFDTKWAARS